MINNSLKDVIVCFFLVYDTKYNIVIDYFLIDNNNNLVKHSKFIYDNFEIPEFKGIKSAVNPEYTKALIGLYLNTGKIRYFTFNINVNIEKFQYFFFPDEYSRKEFHVIKVNYYEETEQYIISWINDHGKILITIYDKNFNFINDIDKYIECEKIYGYSIIYSIITQKYYIISDVNCNGKIYPFNLLYGDINYEKDEAKEKEEEKKEEGKEEKEEEKRKRKRKRKKKKRKRKRKRKKKKRKKKKKKKKKEKKEKKKKRKKKKEKRKRKEKREKKKKQRKKIMEKEKKRKMKKKRMIKIKRKKKRKRII